MAVENGTGLGSPEIIGWAAEKFAAVEVESVGPGGQGGPLPAT
jgi:haloalkane dehalogenase